MIMRIESDNLCLMLKDNNTSIPTRPPTTKNDLSIRRSLYRSSSRCNNINPIVPTRGILLKITRNLALHRPKQCYPFQGSFLSSDYGVSSLSCRFCRTQNLRESFDA